MPIKIDKTHVEYDKVVEKWKMIDDLCDGDKEKIKKYIVYINKNDTTARNVERNRAYRERAVYYNMAGYTSRGMAGQMFRKVPVCNVPDLLKYVEDNIDGSGVSIYQQSQSLAKSQIRKGRGGLLVDFPQTEGGASQADIQSLKTYATIQRFDPEQIIYWRTLSENAVVKLALVRIKDTVEDDGGEFIDIIRELSLEEGVYVSREYRKEEGDWILWTEVVPLDGKGQTWDIIPFMFVGSETNTHTVDNLPMYDIAQINIGHLNNSAEHEEIVFQAGQPQPWMSGLTQDMLDLYAKNDLYWGCGELIGVPSNEQMGITEIKENSSASQAMKEKEKAIIGLGGMFTMPGSAVKTATQAEGEQVVQHSILSLIASNNSEAYTQCLMWMARFMNVPESEWPEIRYIVDQDFTQHSADPQLLMAMLNAANGGKLRTRAFIRWLQKHGIEDAEKEIDEIIEELEAESPAITMPNIGGADE